ncbi:MAG TPA: DMT family transporter [Candidatus Acetothermia bacterium]|nr:DMT family transporter [Candidatus Acetothermia bacterium]
MTGNAAILLVLGAALSWGVAQTVTKLGLSRMDLVPFAAMRAGFALLLVVPYGIITNGFHFKAASLIGMAAFAGLIDSFVGTLLYMYSLKRGEAHEAAALANTAPFWGVVTAVFFLGEPARPIIFLAALLVVVGACFLISPAKDERRPRSIRGGVAALGAALLWGVAETGPAKYCLDRGMPPAEFQLILIGAAALTWRITAFLYRSPQKKPLNSVGVGIAFFTAATGFFLGWILWLSGLKLAEASLLTPIRGGAMTIFAFATSIVVLRERPTPRAFLGAALACSGVVLASLGA